MSPSPKCRRRGPFRLVETRDDVSSHWALHWHLLKAKSKMCKKGPSLKSPFVAVQRCDAPSSKVVSIKNKHNSFCQLLLTVLLTKKAEANSEPKAIISNKCLLFQLQSPLYFSLRRLCNRDYTWQEWIYPWRGSKYLFS